MLLSYKADINYKVPYSGVFTGLTAIHFASNVRDDTRYLELLHRVGANPDGAPKVVRRPLHVAINGSIVHFRDPILSNVKMLLSHGARVDFPHNDGISFLMIAASLPGGEKLVELLLDNGAQVDKQDRGTGRTALSYAAEGHRINSALLLLNHGADIHNQDKDGWSPLFHAVFREKYRQEKEGSNVYGAEEYSIIPLLISKDAEPDIVDNQGKTALTLAGENRDLALCKDLIKENANISECELAYQSIRDNPNRRQQFENDTIYSADAKKIFSIFFDLFGPSDKKSSSDDDESDNLKIRHTK